MTINQYRVIDSDDPRMVIWESEDLDSALVTMLTRLGEKTSLLSRYGLQPDLHRTVYLIHLHHQSVINQYYVDPRVDSWEGGLLDRYGTPSPLPSLPLREPNTVYTLLHRWRSTQTGQPSVQMNPSALASTPAPRNLAVSKPSTVAPNTPIFKTLPSTQKKAPPRPPAKQLQLGSKIPEMSLSGSSPSAQTDPEELDSEQLIQKLVEEAQRLNSEGSHFSDESSTSGYLPALEDLNSDPEELQDEGMDQLPEEIPEDADTEELGRMLMEMQKMMQKEKGEVEEIQEHVQKEVKNFSEFNSRTQNEKRELQREKDREEDRRRIFLSDRDSVYRRFMELVAKKPEKINHPPPMFMKKYPIFRFMDQEGVLGTEQDYPLYLILSNLMYPKPETISAQELVPDKINYLEEEQLEELREEVSEWEEVIRKFERELPRVAPTHSVRPLEEVLADLESSESATPEESWVAEVVEEESSSSTSEELELEEESRDVLVGEEGEADDQSNRSALETHASLEEGNTDYPQGEIIEPPTEEEIAELEEEDAELMEDKPSNPENQKMLSQIAQIINQS